MQQTICNVQLYTFYILETGRYIYIYQFPEQAGEMTHKTSY